MKDKLLFIDPSAVIISFPFLLSPKDSGNNELRGCINASVTEPPARSSRDQ
ncbi:MAG TPA: hypothetical protein VF544_02825 [Pyrinomonadaceae bacterium]|jgi:hypothetical protein